MAARTKKAPVNAEPLTIPEAREALVNAGVEVATRGRLSAAHREQAEALTKRQFPTDA